MMPVRRHTRGQDHADRVRRERGINEARIGADAARLAPNNNDPPPF
ncbi:MULTISPECIES: hypothetical protein [Mycobacterium]|nr:MULTISPECIES: hypothetical protein [Mycobacterium]MDM4139829.1 hypothetical protein [Mycobacterium sp. FLAC0960]